MGVDGNKPWCSGSAFLAGAFAFSEKHVVNKAMVFGVSIPSRGFWFLGKHAPKKAMVFESAYPNKGFCSLGTTWPEGNRDGLSGCDGFKRLVTCWCDYGCSLLRQVAMASGQWPWPAVMNSGHGQRS